MGGGGDMSHRIVRTPSHRLVQHSGHLILYPSLSPPLSSRFAALYFSIFGLCNMMATHTRCASQPFSDVCPALKLDLQGCTRTREPALSGPLCG